MKRLPLSRVENIIRRVVEEPFTWLGSSELDPFQLAAHLTRYFESPSANDMKPNCFTIYISPDDYREMTASIAALERQVADYVTLMAERRGYVLNEAPTVRFTMDPKEVNQRAHVVASCEPDIRQPDTAVYPMTNSDPTHDAIQQADAFLIIQGRQHIPLDRPITRIGRRMDNDIVLDSPSISRYHAQIRWRLRYFVLYDISSHDRTSVNGSSIQEHVLRPGDVIGFSDILVVYGEGRDKELSDVSISADEEMDTTMLKPEE
jgi:pSer/pThr/pTyr-binding forkhead associated (FHA) protein